MTQDIPFGFTVCCDTHYPNTVSAVPAPKQKQGPCFVVVAKPSLLKRSSHGPMMLGELTQLDTLQCEAELGQRYTTRTQS